MVLRSERQSLTMWVTKKCGCEVKGKMKRIAYLDTVKLLTIFLVILGHVTQMMVNGWVVGEHLWKPIYSFHVPLFMLVSGYFVSDRTLNNPLGKMVIVKAKQLLLPVFTCTMVCCIYLFLVRDSVNYRDEIIGNSWFLKVLFVYYVLFLLLKRTKLNDWLLFVLSCFFLFLVPKGSTLQVNLLWPYFFVGYLLKKYQVLDKMIGKWQVIVVFLLLYLFTYALQWNLKIPNIITINHDNLFNLWYLILFRYIVAFCGSMSAILLVAWVYERWSKKTLLNKISNYGKYTLGIYVFQTLLIINIFPDTFAWYVESKWMLDILVSPLLSIGFLIICIWLVVLCSKFRMFDLFLFGGQYYKR